MSQSKKYFTSLFEDYHLHVEIFHQSSQLHIEVLNLKTFNFFSCIIKEQSLNPQDSIWFENLGQLYEAFFDGLKNPSEKIKVIVTDHKNICLILSKEPSQYKVFEYDLQETMTTSSLLLEGDRQNGRDSDEMGFGWEKISRMIMQTRHTDERIKEFEEQLERLNQEKEITDLRIKKLEKRQESSNQEINTLKGELKKCEKLEEEMQKIKEQLDGKVENIPVFKGEIPLVKSVEMVANHSSVGNQVIEAMGACYERFKEELVKFSKDTQEVIVQHKEESLKQYQQFLEQRLAEHWVEVYDNFEDIKKNFEEMEEVEIKRVAEEIETRVLKIQEEFERKLIATERKVASSYEAMYKSWDSLLRKIEILEKRHLPLKNDLQTFKAFEVTFDKNLGYLSTDKKTIECQLKADFDEKSFFSGSALPDSGKYSISFKYDQGEFKENGSLVFGVFPFVNRQKPLNSSYKYMIDVLNDQALVEENQFEIDKIGKLNPGTVITMYVDLDQKDISFVVDGVVRLSYPLSHWLDQKMYCGVFMRNIKKFKFSFL